MDRLLIIDGHAYAYRAFHAIRNLRSPSGQPTNAIYGFIKTLAKMRANIEPTHWIVVWDGGLSEKRMAELPEYKAQRPEMPDDLRPHLDGFVCYLNAAGMSVVIASADKDFMQLVSEQVGLLNPHDKTETVWTDEQVRAKTGVAPDQIVDWLSLRGDAVDNIPGVPGVGVKTATELLQQFGSVEKIYERLDEVKSEKLRTALRIAQADVRRNRVLVRLHDDLPCEFSPDEMVVGRAADGSRLRQLYGRWGFKTLLTALEDSARECQAVLI